MTQTFNDFEIQLAMKLRTDLLSLYRKMSLLVAPELWAIHTHAQQCRYTITIIHCQINRQVKR